MYNEIWEDVESVIRYSQEYCEDMSIDLTELRVKWEQNKKKWLDMWGGPILEMPQPIIFNLNQETKEKEVLEFCNWVERKYHAYDLSNFIWGVRQSFFENKVLDLVNIFIPPMSSNTMSAQVLKKEGSQEVGRKEKPDDQKSEKTIKKIEGFRPLKLSCTSSYQYPCHSPWNMQGS